MSTQDRTLVWIDHRLAKVIHFTADGSDSSTVHSSHSHQNLHHKANSIDSGHAPVDKEFFERVARALERAGTLLITGPASAKTELHAHLKHLHPAIAARVSGVEPLDHPSDGELLAHARRFFEAGEQRPT